MKLSNIVYFVQFLTIDDIVEEYQYANMEDAMYHYSMFGPDDADVYKSICICLYDYSTKRNMIIDAIDLSA